MKQTLARSPVALRALMTWYDLRDQVVPFLGERPTTLFAHSISAGTDCLICSTFFRRLLIDAGENPEALRLDDWEQTIVAYGRQLAVDPHSVTDELFDRLAARLQPDQIVALTAFGGLMVATNLFNNNALTGGSLDVITCSRTAQGRQQSMTTDAAATRCKRRPTWPARSR